MGRKTDFRPAAHTQPAVSGNYRAHQLLWRRWPVDSGPLLHAYCNVALIFIAYNMTNFF